MIDPIRSDEIHADLHCARDAARAAYLRARDADRAAQKRALAEARAGLGVTAADDALFTAIYYNYIVPASDLPELAARKAYPQGEVTEAECRAALTGCLAKGWLQVIDEASLGAIVSELQAGGVLGPVYRLPDVGGVDFTAAGADLWKRLCEWGSPASEFFHADTDVVHLKTTRYFRTLAAAAAGLEEIRDRYGIVALAGPTPIGPWRTQWWRRFPEGYRIDFEERWQWQGWGSGGGETCCLDRPERSADLDRLQHVLGRHDVTLAEWLALQNVDSSYGRYSATGPGASVSDEQRLGAVEACLRAGWLRVMDRRATDEVRALVAADSAHLALPRTAELRRSDFYYVADPACFGKRVLQPCPDEHWLGGIDFSPAGAALYRTISAEWLGPDWEDAISVSREYYWEEHHYCVAEEGFDGIVEKHLVQGERVRASRVVPIGPWWDRFPAGFRLEVELGEP